MRSQMHKLNLVIAVVAVAFFAISRADAKTWNGPSGGDWSTNNWDGAGAPPSGGDTAVIPGGSNVVVTTAVPVFTGNFQPGSSGGTTTLTINTGGVLAPSFGGNNAFVNQGGGTMNFNILNGGAYSPTFGGGGAFTVENGTVNLTVDGTSTLSGVNAIHTNNASRLYISVAAGATFQAVSLRGREGGSQVFDLSGTGTINLTSTGSDALRNNGRIEANGGVLSLVYDYTRFGNNSGAAETMDDGQIAGYYAINGGTLRMPDVILGSNVRSWGNRHDTGADNIPLINSLQFTGSGMSGTIDVEILALDHVSVLPGLINPVGVWQMSELTGISGVTGLTAHYDDFLATTGNGPLTGLGINEADLRMFFNDGSGWAEITNGLPIVASDLIKGLPTSFNGQFAVATAFSEASAVPEPSSYALGLIGLAGLGLVVWRRRRIDDCGLRIEDCGFSVCSSNLTPEAYRELSRKAVAAPFAPRRPCLLGPSSRERATSGITRSSQLEFGACGRGRGWCRSCSAPSG